MLCCYVWFEALMAHWATISCDAFPEMTDWFCVHELTCSSCHLMEVYALSCLRSAGFAHSLCSTLLSWNFILVRSACLCLQQLSEALNCYLPWQMSNFTKIFLISAAMSVIGHSRNNKLLGRYLHAWFLLKPVLEVRRVPDQTVLRVEASSEQLCGTSFSM